MEQSYWNGNGRHQALADQLQKLIPAEGAVANPARNKALERFRKAVNCYYDLYNNGLCNRVKQFAGVFKFGSAMYKLPYCYSEYSNALYSRTEEVMDAIILQAAQEQKVDIQAELVV